MERSSWWSLLTPLERRGKAAAGGFYLFLGGASCPAPTELVALQSAANWDRELRLPSPPYPHSSGVLWDWVGCSPALPSHSSPGTHRGPGHSPACLHEVPSGLGGCVLGPCSAPLSAEHLGKPPPGREQQRWGVPGPHPAGMPVSPSAAWQRALKAKRVSPSKPSCSRCLQGEELLLLEISPFPSSRAVFRCAEVKPSRREQDTALSYSSLFRCCGGGWPCSPLPLWCLSALAASF